MNLRWATFTNGLDYLHTFLSAVKMLNCMNILTKKYIIRFLWNKALKTLQVKLNGSAQIHMIVPFCKFCTYKYTNKHCKSICRATLNILKSNNIFKSKLSAEDKLIMMHLNICNVIHRYVNQQQIKNCTRLIWCQ